MNSTENILALLAGKKRIIRNAYLTKTMRYCKSLANLPRPVVNALVLLSLDHPLDLCVFLGVKFVHLQDIMNHPAYKQFRLRKKKKGFRLISVPSKNLKKIQRKLNYFLQAYYLCIKPDNVNGFVIHPRDKKPYCNIVENARPHVGKRHVLNLDLQDFFPGISARRVKEVFSSPLFSFNEEISTALTLLTTYEGKLPAGAPSSPVISNFICQGLDRELAAFATCHSLTYTRYADDLTFSSDAVISDELISEIIHLIEKNHFNINQKKIRLRSNARKQTVTGITVNEKVNVDRNFLKKIRAMLHDSQVNGLMAATQRHFKLSPPIYESDKITFTRRLQGYIEFVGQVRGKDDPVYNRFKFYFDNVSKSI